MYQVSYIGTVLVKRIHCIHVQLTAIDTIRKNVASHLKTVVTNILVLCA